MRVPNEVVGRTRPSGQGLDYLNVPTNANMFGAAVGTGLQSISEGLKAWEQRDATTEHYTALTDFSDFETQTEAGLTELKRHASPDGRGFVKQATDYYTKAESEFLAKKIPANLRPEFEYRSGEIRNKVLGDAISFQYQAGDASYQKGVDTEYQKGLTALDPKTGGDPKQLEYWRKRMTDNINATDLPAGVKADLIQKTSIGLEGVAYKANYKDAAAQSGVALPPQIGSIVDAAAAKYGENPRLLRTIVQIESKGDPNAESPTGAQGIAQFTKGTAAQYGLVNRKDPVESADALARLTRDNRAGLRKALGREPTDGEVYLAHQQGLGGATALLRNPNAMAVDILGRAAVVGNGGKEGMTAGEFANLWINQVNKTNPNLDSDPAYSNLTYEDRINAQRDAEAEVVREQNDANQAAKAVYQTQLNSLLTGIVDGTKGRTEIDDARQSWLTNADDIKKAEDWLATANKNQNLIADFSAKLKDPYAVFDPTDDNEKKAQNAYVGKAGLERLGNADEGYFTNSVLPTAQQTHDIPTDVIGLFTGMIRSNNQTKALFAFDALSQLRNADQRAFDMRVPESLAKDVATYDSLKNLLPADELMSRINGGATLEERSRRDSLAKDAQAYLQTSSGGKTHLEEGITKVLSKFSGGYFPWSSAELVTVPSFAKQLQDDYQALFTDFYKQVGDPEKASDMTVEALKRDWAETSIGTPILMKYPPEKTYPQFGGDWSWIDRQARALFQVGPEDTFQLLSDQQTANEWRLFQSGQGNPPSYMAVVIGPDQVPRLRQDVNGNPLRYSFKPSAAEFADQTREFNLDNARHELQRLMPLYEGAKLLEIQQGIPVPQEYIDQKKNLEDQIQQFARPPRNVQQEYNDLTPEQRTFNPP